MNEYLLYLFQSTVILGLFYAVDFLILKKDTHYGLRRGFLLMALLASTLLPFLDMNFLSYEFASPMDEVSVFISGSVSTDLVETDTLSSQQGAAKYLGVIYSIGLGFMLLRLGWIVWQLSAMIKGASVQTYGSYYFCHGPKISSPFSFFRYIFSGEDVHSLDPVILAHEMQHAKLRHSYDLIWAEVYLLVFWFNPFAWLSKKALQEVHEFEVDASVLQEGINKKTYQRLLLEYSISAPKLTIVHSFNHITLKKRISMMNKKKSPKRSQFKYLTVIPLAFLSMFLMAHKGADVNPMLNLENRGEEWAVEGKVLDAVTNAPIVGATILIEGTHVGSLTNDKGEFALEIPEASPVTLRFAFVGKASYSVEVSESGGLTVYLQNEGNQGKHTFEARKVTVKKLSKSEQKIALKNLNKGKQPLIIVDGKEMKRGKMSDLEPGNIESVEVLKGEKAIEKYGKKGKNGVVIVKTKKE